MRKTTEMQPVSELGGTLELTEHHLILWGRRDWSTERWRGLGAVMCVGPGWTPTLRQCFLTHHSSQLVLYHNGHITLATLPRNFLATCIIEFVWLHYKNEPLPPSCFGFNCVFCGRISIAALPSLRRQVEVPIAVQQVKSLASVCQDAGSDH